MSCLSLWSRLPLELVEELLQGVTPPILGKASQLDELFCRDTNHDFLSPTKQAWRANMVEPVYMKMAVFSPDLLMCPLKASTSFLLIAIIMAMVAAFRSY